MCTKYPACKWQAEISDWEIVAVTAPKHKWWAEYERRVDAVLEMMPDYPSEVGDGLG